MRGGGRRLRIRPGLPINILSCHCYFLVSADLPAANNSRVAREREGKIKIEKEKEGMIEGSRWFFRSFENPSFFFSASHGIS